MLEMAIGDGNYPGDQVASANWPGTAPGESGVNNAISPRYCDLSGFADAADRPDVLWIRGDEDQIVSDASLVDLGHLGALGVVPGWPGPEVFPPQPMVGQMRAVLDRYQAGGGRYTEHVLRRLRPFPPPGTPSRVHRCRHGVPHHGRVGSLMTRGQS